MAWVPAVAAGITALGGIFGSKRASDKSVEAQREANAANIGMQKEQLEWQERMANSEVQRRVSDLKAAGLNPMLGYSSAASTPNVQPAKVESVGEAYREHGRNIGRSVDTGMQAYMQAAQRTQMQLQNANLAAQTKKTAAEASIIEATVPFSAGNAATQADTLKKQFTKLGYETTSAMREADIKLAAAEAADLSLEQQRDLQPLLLAYQNLLNQAAKAGLPEKEAEAAFFSQIGEGGKWIQLIRSLIKR